jgi:phosphoribosylformimino-5-aminoimidazole carboxamide ribotide isomerase
MHVVGVIDARGGLAVHARGGRRDDYAPIGKVGNTAIPPGDAVRLAVEYIRTGIDHLYIADLDAIAGSPPQRDLVRGIAALGVTTWVDAGISSIAAARHTTALGASTVIVGLETLESLDTLAAIAREIGGDRVAFSLDLRAGRPIGRSGVFPDDADPETIATEAAAAGAGTIVVLDLARVGGATGVDAGLIRRLRSRFSTTRLAAGGGVRGPDDLLDLAAAGCDAALVASAVLEGRLTPADVAAAQDASVSR